MIQKVIFRTLGPETLLMEWPEVISRETLTSVTDHFKAITSKLEKQIITCYPAYCSIAIHFDTNQISAATLQESILQLDIMEQSKSERQFWELPVCYTETYGLDLLRIAEAKKITPEEIILLHTQNSYPVHFFGFLPGFMYLGGLPASLHHPRKQTPSRKIPQGSVAIGGSQTGIYPSSSPGGWHVIGNCPIPMFDPAHNPPCFISMGDEVKFSAVHTDEYLFIKDQVAQKNTPLKPPPSMGEIIVKKPGLHTSIQDLGREKWKHFGVPVSGAMDQRSARLANLLINNAENTPVIEITMIGPQLLFTEPAVIGLTGANLSPQLDGHDIGMNQSLQVSSGQILTFGKPLQGIRAYLSLKGGLDCPEVLGSHSQYPMVTHSGSLQEGDRLSYGSRIESSKNNAIVQIDPQHFTNKTLKAHPGPEFDLLSDQARQLLLNNSFHINANNRMGYQLMHPDMPPHQIEIITAPVIPGTIQLTPSGQLIALMRDAQVTGGYPRVLQLTRESIDQLAQKTNNDVIQFHLV